MTRQEAIDAAVRRVIPPFEFELMREYLRRQESFVFVYDTEFHRIRSEFRKIMAESKSRPC